MSNAAVPKPTRKSRSTPKAAPAASRRFTPSTEERVRAARRLRQLRLPVGTVAQMKKESIPDS